MTRYQELLEKGRNDDTTVTTFSIKYYYTHEMAAVTDDIPGWIDFNVAVLNEQYENRNIPMIAKVHCIEHSYLHNRGKILQEHVLLSLFTKYQKNN